MFVGHGLLAFALVAGVAGLAGRRPRRAAALGVAAGAFAAVPDVDVSYALVGVVGTGPASPLALASAFWSTGNVVHRAVTHSLLVAPVAAAVAALWAAGLRRRGRADASAAALAGLAALVAAAGAVSGPLAAAVMALFGAALLGVATLAVRRGGLGARATLAAALVGLWSHPFGDLFTGEPPALVYPLRPGLPLERVVLHPDPTLHLLGAFGLELAAAWLAALVAARLAGVRTRPAPRATLGAGFAAALPLIPTPTLSLSYPFVFGVLGVGALALLPGLWTADAGEDRAVAADGGPAVAVLSQRPPGWARALLTGLAAVTAAWGAYGVAYLALG